MCYTADLRDLAGFGKRAFVSELQCYQERNTQLLLNLCVFPCLQHWKDSILWEIYKLTYTTTIIVNKFHVNESKFLRNLMTLTIYC